MHRNHASAPLVYYQSGIPGIDAQHRDLLLMMDGFLDSLEKGKSDDYLALSIDEILGRFRSHIATEESLLDMVGFPKTAAHKNQHREIMNQVTEVFKNLMSMDSERKNRIIRVFYKVMLTHIEINDREYVDFIDNLIQLRKKFSITALKARDIVR